MQASMNKQPFPECVKFSDSQVSFHKTTTNRTNCNVFSSPTTDIYYSEEGHVTVSYGSRNIGESNSPPCKLSFFYTGLWNLLKKFLTVETPSIWKSHRCFPRKFVISVWKIRTFINILPKKDSSRATLLIFLVINVSKVLEKYTKKYPYLLGEEPYRPHLPSSLLVRSKLLESSN